MLKWLQTGEANTTVLKNANKELHVLLDLVSIPRHNFAWHKLNELILLLIPGILVMPRWLSLEIMCIETF